jgi:hypothetical protein
LKLAPFAPLRSKRITLFLLVPYWIPLRAQMFSVTQVSRSAENEMTP